LPADVVVMLLVMAVMAIGAIGVRFATFWN
jgi:hypothetical protein